MVMAIDRVSETVALTQRPRFQETRVYSQFEISGHRRHKQEITLRPTLTPVKYADTAYLLINNTRRRYVSRTFYESRLQPCRYADTTYASPKTAQERFVTYLDAHADQTKSWFKTSVEIMPRKFKSSVAYPDVTSVSPKPVKGDVSKGNPLPNGNSHSYMNGLDENMNRRIPDFQEKFDPGASQVFIPKRKERSAQDIILDGIGDQVLVDYKDLNGNSNGFAAVNGYDCDGTDC